jgi:hypothetical protein
MIEIIHQFCKFAHCKPADIVLEWDVKTGARLTAKGSNGEKSSLNVLCSLNHIAQALLLVTNGEEKRYPQLREQQNQLEAKIREWQTEEGLEASGTGVPATADKDVSVKDWRRAKDPAEVLQGFPAAPKADELIDLYLLNKTFASPELANLLIKHSR